MTICQFVIYHRIPYYKKVKTYIRSYIEKNIYIYRTSVFHTKKIKIKNKDLKSPGINIDIKRSSKLKQLLYEKFYKKFK